MGRLRLSPWKEEDLEPVAATNLNPSDMESFPGLSTCEESDLNFEPKNRLWHF
jgi:hypothetical protein